MLDIASLPDSLREQIQETASSILPKRTAEPSLPTDPLQNLLVEIARQSPEILLAMLLDSSRFVGLETTETEETSEDKVIETFISGSTYREVQPMKTTKTIRRQVRFLTEERATLRSRAR